MDLSDLSAGLSALNRRVAVVVTATSLILAIIPRPHTVLAEMADDDVPADLL